MWYFSPFRLKLSSMLVPSAVMRERNSSLAEHLVDALFLGVQRLAAQGQDGLKTAVAALLGAAAGAVALYDEQLVQLRLAAGAAGQLAHQRGGLQRVLGAGHVPGLPGGFPDMGGADGLFHQLLAQLLIFQVFQK